MGCSDRFDYLEKCAWVEQIGGMRWRCPKYPDKGVYCVDHQNQPLRKEDAEHTIAELKEKYINHLIEWLESK